MTPEGKHAVAVFEPLKDRSPSQTGDHTIAFVVSAARFIEIAHRAKSSGPDPPPGMPAKSIDHVDIGLAISVLIEGPENTRLEVTCHELEVLRARLAFI